MPHLSPAVALGVAAATGVAATYGMAVRTATGQRFDDRLAQAAASRRRVRHPAKRLLHPYREVPFAVTATGMGGAGLATRGVARTACASAALLLTIGQVEALKHALPRPNLTDDPTLRDDVNSYPSGHTAGVAALAAMAVILAPRRPLAVGVTGAALTGAVGAATVAARWHRPSDVMGALLSGLQWGAFGVAAADAIEHR